MLFLAAIWGASFLFMRTAAPEFGPVALITVRVGLAAIVLVGLIVWQGKFGQLRAAWRKLLLLGIMNSCLPFMCFAWAALTLPAGVASILNATAPLWAAIIGAVWLRERLATSRIIGLVIAFGGVIILIWAQGRLSAVGTSGGSLTPAYLLAVGGCLLATLLYGISSNYTKEYLQGTDPAVNAAGSQLSSIIVLLPLIGFFLPPQIPSNNAWWAAVLLAVFCTALAYLMFFRLINRIGPTRTVTVTFLIPVFGCLFGVLFLKEAFTIPMLLGAAVVLLGTAMAVGLLKRGSTKAPIRSNPSR
jgi:drug/metabolite transporter (DMT)-like permease